MGKLIFKCLTRYLKILAKSVNNFSFYGHFVEGRRSKCPFVYIEKYKLSKNHTKLDITNSKSNISFKTKHITMKFGQREGFSLYFYNFWKFLDFGHFPQNDVTAKIKIFLKYFSNLYLIERCSFLTDFFNILPQER